MKHLVGVFLHLGFCISGIVSYNCDVEPKTKDGMLRKKLFCGKYDKTERPVKSHNDVVRVYVHMDLQNFDFEDQQQKLFLNVWLVLLWKDAFMTWNSMEYEGIKQLVIESEDIWFPDILPYSSYSNSNLDGSCTTPKCQLESDGTVKYVPACEYHVLCVSDFTNWPYDRQNCTLRIGMWVEDSSEVNFDRNSTTLRTVDGEAHNQWKIVTSSVQKHDSLIGTDAELGNTTYPSLIYNFILERHSGSHSAVLLAPVFVMIAINLIAIGLNCESRERLLLLAGNTFFHLTFIVHLYWQVPYNGTKVPLILVYFRNSLLLTSLMLVFTILIKHLSLKQTTEPPAAVGTIVNVLTGNPVGGWLFGTSVGVDQLEDPKGQRETTAASEDNSGDTVVLVGEDRLPESGPKVVIMKGGAYSTAALVLDKCLFLGFVALYGLMVISLIPRG